MAGGTAERAEKKSLDYALAGVALPPAEPGLRNANQMRAELLQDPAWVSKYLQGDVEAREQMATINQALVANIPDEE